MRILSVVIFIFLLFTPLFPQKTSTKKSNNANSPSRSTQVSTAISTASIQSEPKLDAKSKPSDEDEEKGEVLVDYSVSLQSLESEGEHANEIPNYFGTLKGVTTYEGKLLLVFEGEDGTITFIHVYRKGKIFEWDVLGQIRRS